MAPREFGASQIEFVAHADPAATRKHFAKGGRTIIPNPSRRYGVLNPVLYFYYELYNLPEFTGAAFMATYSLQDKNGRALEFSILNRLERYAYDSTTQGLFRSHHENNYSFSGGAYWAVSPRLTAALAYYRPLDYEVNWPFALVFTKNVSSYFCGIRIGRIARMTPCAYRRERAIRH